MYLKKYLRYQNDRPAFMSSYLETKIELSFNLRDSSAAKSAMSQTINRLD